MAKGKDRRPDVIAWLGLALFAGLALAEIAALVKHPRRTLAPELAVAHLQPQRFDAVVAAIQAARPKDEYRILVTGGSAAAGHGAETVEGTFPYQLERRLRARFPGKNIKVYNAGVLGMDSSGEVLFYLKYLHRLKPDLVIMFTGFNDLWDTIKRQTDPDRWAPVRDMGNYRFLSPTSPGQQFGAFLKAAVLAADVRARRLSRLYELAQTELHEMDQRPMLNLHAFRFEDAAEDVETFLDAAHAFHALSERDGFTFVLVLQPISSLSALPLSEHPISRWEAKVRLLYRDALVPRLRALARKDRFEALDLNENGLVDELIRAGAFHQWDFCHLNGAGYGLVAGAVERFLVDRRLLKAARR